MTHLGRRGVMRWQTWGSPISCGRDGYHDTWQGDLATLVRHAARAVLATQRLGSQIQRSHIDYTQLHNMLNFCSYHTLTNSKFAGLCASQKRDGPLWSRVMRPSRLPHRGTSALCISNRAGGNYTVGTPPAPMPVQLINGGPGDVRDEVPLAWGFIQKQRSTHTPVPRPAEKFVKSA